MLDDSTRSTAEVEDEMMATINKAFEKSGIKIPATNEAGQELSSIPKTAPDPATGALISHICYPDRRYPQWTKKAYSSVHWISLGRA